MSIERYAFIGTSIWKPLKRRKEKIARTTLTFLYDFLFDYLSFEFLTPGISRSLMALGKGNFVCASKLYLPSMVSSQCFKARQLPAPLNPIKSISRLERTEDGLSLFPTIKHVTLSKPKFTRGRDTFPHFGLILPRRSCSVPSGGSAFSPLLV